MKSRQVIEGTWSYETRWRVGKRPKWCQKIDFKAGIGIKFLSPWRWRRERETYL